MSSLERQQHLSIYDASGRSARVLLVDEDAVEVNLSDRWVPENQAQAGISA
ncbi:hypothetical protein ACQ4M4_20670 [Leptolyngbya sp. AN02str]|uniref:hypothetical protein n=1 Tax=Leptolyngbya sp. AN02str TaxID=3423363 RepID=UPI003D315CDB